MRTSDAARIGALLLCMILAISMLTGCANRLLQKSEEQVLMEAWQEVLNDGENLVYQIEIKYVDAEPGKGSYPVETVMITDSETVKEVRDVFALSNITWESAETDDSSIDAYTSAVSGKDRLSVTFLDAQGNKLKKFTVAENNVGDYLDGWVMEDETTLRWIGFCRLTFTDQTYSTIKGIFDRANTSSQNAQTP